MPATEAQLAPARPRCHWFQYSLRTLTVFMVLASVPMSWLAVKMHQATEQREAVEAIVKLGGSVTYDTDISKAPAPRWLWRLFGDDFFSTVFRVHFPSVPVTDTNLERLKGLTQLQQLCLSSSQITDAGLEHLKGLTQLQELFLWHTHVSDEGVKRLQQTLPNSKVAYK